MSSIQSALVILVPEAEALTKAFRDRYDPSASAGMPAHITLLFPFKPLDELRTGVLDKLQHCFTQIQPFGFSLTATRRFQPQVLYLAPEPDEPFRRITQMIWTEFPDTPPYDGKYQGIVPHLTVAQMDSHEQLDPVAEMFALACESKPPIHATATEIALMDNRSGRWQARSVFALANSKRPEP